FGYLLQTIIIFCATVIAAVWGNAFLRKKATIDYILNLQRDKRLRQAKRHLLGMDIQEIEQHANNLSQPDSIRDDLLYLLNCYEYFAVGIHEKCFHEKLARRLNQSLMILIWQRYKPFIDALRKDKNLPTLYSELENLVVRWSK
ncbi:MAG: DUF4760 domain-containing protein, partial [Motiliproteus sp.]|nr:DUF4760 domain-containing protein [Motiliproteus sp.]